jgi:hypothetical protein
MAACLLDRMVTCCNCDSYNTNAETDDFVVVMVRMDSCNSRATATGSSCNNIIMLYKWVVLYFVEDVVGNNYSLQRISVTDTSLFVSTKDRKWLLAALFVLCYSSLNKSIIPSKLSGRRDGKTLGQ